MKQFKETQRFKQWFVWLPLIIMFIAFTWIIIQEFILEKPLGDQPMDKWAILPMIMAPSLVLALMLVFKLKTYADEKVIRFSFFPFHFKSREINWDEVERAYVREYKPIREYGGWGLRSSIRNGRAYNVSGNKGIQLELNSGKKILIGTQLASEIELLFLHLRKKYPGKFNYEKG